MMSSPKYKNALRFHCSKCKKVFGSSIYWDNSTTYCPYCGSLVTSKCKHSIKCAYCKEPFTPQRKEQKFCSLECVGFFNRRKNEER